MSEAQTTTTPAGIGRELGMEGLEEYLESKRVCIDSSPTFHIR